MTVRFILFLILLLSLQFAATAQGKGYRLEFQSVMTMSTDTVGLPPAGTSIVRTFTVPDGCVLKITAGNLYSASGLNNSGQIMYKYQTVLSIDNNKILGEDRNGFGLGVVSNKPVIINGDNPVWAGEKQVVSLMTTYYNYHNGYLANLYNNWISGVVFKLVAN